MMNHEASKNRPDAAGHQLPGPLHRFANLYVDHTHGYNSAHKALLVLMMLARLKYEKTTYLSYNEIEPVLKQLLQLFTAHGLGNSSYPFWFLRSDRVWEVDIDPALVFSAKAKKPNLMALRKYNPKAGFSENILEWFSRNLNDIDKVADFLLALHFPDVQIRHRVRSAVGLHNIDLGEAELNFSRDVLYTYKSRCAICHQALRLINLLATVRAAHFQKPRLGGADSTSNGIALCSLHRAQFTHGVVAFELISKTKQVLSAKILVSKHVLTEKASPPDYQSLHLPDMILLPANQHPSRKFVDWHRNNIFADNAYQRPMPR